MRRRVDSGPVRWPWVVLFVGATFALLSLGYAYYTHETERIRQEKYSELATIAGLKAGQIGEWRKERLEDGWRSANGPFFRKALPAWLRDPNNTVLQRDLLDRYVFEQETQGYADVVLFDLSGHVLLSAKPQPQPLNPTEEQTLEEALKKGSAMMSDLYRSQQGIVQLDAVAPIMDQGGQPIAVVVMRINAESLLYPLIQTWPTPSRTSETLLVRKEGAELLFLNDLRHRPNTALSLREPLTQTHLPGVQAVLGKQGRFQGNDYRGVEVLADLRPIPESTWFMVAKVDTSEIMAESRYRGLVTALFAGLFILFAAGVTAYGYRYRQARLYQHLYQSERGQREAQERFRTTLYSIGEAVITTDTGGLVEQMNPVAELLTGWLETEARGKPLLEIFHIVNEDSRKEVENPVKRVLREGHAVVLANHTLLIAKDGTEHAIADSGAPIRDGTGSITGVVLVFRDQTQERMAQEELTKSHETLETILNNVPIMVAFLDRDGHHKYVNRCWQDILGWSLHEAQDTDVMAEFYPDPDYRQYLADHVATADGTWGEFRTRTRDGRLIDTSWANVPLSDGSSIGIGLDVTERKRGEQALRDSEERFRTIAETIAEVFWMADIRIDTMFYVNPAYEQVWGRSTASLYENPRSFLDAIHEEDRERVLADLEIRKSGQPFDFEYRIVRPNGEIRWIWDQGFPVRDDTGQISRYVGVAQDITDRRLVEKALRDSEERYRAVFENAAIGIDLLDRDGRIIQVNQALLDMLGYTREEISQITFLDITFPDDKEISKRNLEALQAREIDSYRFEKRYLRKDGSILWADLSTSAITDTNGGPTRAVGVISDITERKRAEDALSRNESMLRNILSTSPVGIVGLSVGRTINWANEACLNMFGFESEEEVVGRTAAIVYPSDAEYGRVGKILYEGLKTGKTTSVDATLKRKDGSLFDGHIRMKALGKSDLAIAVISDISERRRHEESLKESEARIRTKLDSILLPEGDIGALELADVIDVPSIQALMGDFFSLTKIPVGMIDLKGKVLVATGWQEICTKFHRLNPETCQHCIESDTMLSGGVEQGSFKLYRCKNNMWDIATPIIVGGKHLGNLFLGQFLFEDESPDYEVFRSQARQYGFDEEQYLGAFEKVPRWSRETVDKVMTFYARLANMASTLSYSSIKLARSLANQERSEEALRASEEKYRATFNNAAVGMDLVNHNGRFLEVNDTLSNFLGYAREELKNLTILDVTYPEDAESTKQYDALVQGRIENYRLEKRYLRKDGAVVWADLYVSAIRDRDGEHRTTVGVIVDITSRKKSEEMGRRLATAVEQAAEAIVITDPLGTIQYVNPSVEKISGYKREEVLGKTTSVFKSGEHDQAFYRNLWETINRGEVWTGRFINKRKDGSLYHEEATISPVRGSGGEIINFVAVKRDVTEHLQLSRQLLQAQKMEAIGTLAGGIAHDFNNLLQVTLGFSELLLAEKREDDPEYADLSKIFQAGKSGAELVQRLLTFSRKVEPKPIPLNLNIRILQVEKLLRRTIPKMIDIQLDLPDDLGDINADPTQMEQVLMNLAVNARDAMPDRGKLTLGTKNVTLDEKCSKTHIGACPGDYVLLTVSDTGHGMDKATLEHIFEPFYTTKELGRGTGLGLAMVYGIVKQHGGYITCESEIGRGTTFNVYLPAIESRLEPDVTQTGVMPAFGTETILLVDDEEFVRDLGARILSKAGYSVLTATNGREALDLFERERTQISLVILDLIMPEMGGKECLKELRKIDPQLKVLIASGLSADPSTKESVEMGTRGFVSKPFRIKELLRQVRNVLDES